MTVGGGNNHYAVGEMYESTIGSDFAALDALPKPIRLAIIESRFEWPADMVLENFKLVMADVLDRDIAIHIMLEMVKMNERDLLQKGWKFYIDLEVTMRSEKRARIEAAFQRAS